MISTALAADLRAAGLVWTPTSGDAFQINGPDFEGDVFTVSDMTIEAHTYATGTVLGFNGTTEWALDSVALDDALWLPREDQLRDALAGTFVGLVREVAGDTDERASAESIRTESIRTESINYVVTTSVNGAEARVVSDDPAEAYGLALLALLRSLA
ncbi:MAG: pilus assembly protein CpaE [Pseudolysinimonas sp.]